MAAEIKPYEGDAQCLGLWWEAAGPTNTDLEMTALPGTPHACELRTCPRALDFGVWVRLG